MTKQLVRMRLADIIPYENNPRHNDNAVEAVKESIKQCEYIAPIIVDEDHIILAGHTRAKALDEMGVTDADVMVVTGLSDEQKRKYRLLDNKTNELATWDIDKLEIELEDINFDGFDFGFDVEIEEIPPEVVEDEVPETAEPRCKLGDLWQLGEHRLMCGDSTDPNVIEQLMGGVTADIAFTSPPYNVGDSAVLNGNTHMKECKYQSGNDDLSDYDELLAGATDNMLTHCKWVFINLQMLANNKQIICEWLNNYKDALCDIGIWYKSSTAPAMAEKVMNSQYEFIFIFSNINSSRAIGTKMFRGTVSNVYTGSAQRNNEYAAIHSATFPIEFASHYVYNFTNAGDTVLDVFGGTGTTMIACEQLNRKCYMCELDEHYCDVIIERWENFTGQKAVLLNG